MADGGSLEEILDPTDPDESESPDALSGVSDSELVSIIKEFKRESEDSRLERDTLNRRNWAAYQGQQDWSEKNESQSAEFLPKIPMAAEQISAFIRRGLVAFGDWFQATVTPNPKFVGLPLTDESIVKLIRARIEGPVHPNCAVLDFPTVIADGVKVAVLSAVIVLKIHGYTEIERRFSVQTVDRTQPGPDGQPVVVGAEEELVLEEIPVWYPAIDLIRPEDYYPDPTGQGLYEIHRTQMDLHRLVELAEQGLYNAEEVALIKESFSDAEREYELVRKTNQNHSERPSFRKQVVLDEFWGTLIDREGNVLGKNIVVTIANEKHVIRGPEPNPFWHQLSPFVAAPLVRVPFSAHHKALFDHATDLNIALNELFNLMLDGAIGSVWGVRQIKMSAIENAAQFTDGIPQGATLLLKEDFPDGAKAMETVSTGQLPADGLAMFNILDKEVQGATLTPDLKLGLLPQRQVKATEIVEASQQSSVFFDGIIFDLENNIITPTLYKVWLTLLQHADDWRTSDVVGILGEAAAHDFAMMSPARRYAAYGQGLRFRVFGLSQVLSRVKEFQKMMALFQVVGTNALLLQAFTQEFSPEKALQHIFKSLNIDPTNLQLSEEEKAGLQQKLQQLPFYQELIRSGGGNRGVGGGDGSGLSAQQTGEPNLPAEVNQAANPLTGIQG